MLKILKNQMILEFLKTFLFVCLNVFERLAIKQKCAN